MCFMFQIPASMDLKRVMNKHKSGELPSLTDRMSPKHDEINLFIFLPS